MPRCAGTDCIESCREAKQKSPLLSERAKSLKAFYWQVLNLNEASRVEKLKLPVVL